MLKNILKVGFISLIPLILIIGFIFFLKYKYGQRQEEQKGDQLLIQLKELTVKAGFSLEKSLTVPEVPPEQNGNDLYQQIFALLDKTPISNNLNNYVEFRLETPDTTTLEEPLDEKKIREELNQLGPLFELLSQATAKERTVFPLKYEDLSEMEMPHLSHLKELSRLLICKAFIQLDDQNNEASLQTINQIFRLTQPLEEEYVLLSALVSLPIRRLGIQAASLILSQSPYHQKFEEQLMQQLKKINPKEMFFRGMKGEVYCVSFLFERWKTGEYSTEKVLKSLESPFPQDKFWDSTSLSIEMDIKKYKDRSLYYKNSIDLMQQYEKSDIEIENALTQIQDSTTKFPFETPINSIVYQNIPHIWWRIKQNQMNNSCFILYLQARQFYHKTGRYPKALADLKNEFIEVPCDPASQKDLHYSLTPESILIYSNGLNNADDGGKLEPSSTGEFLDIGLKISLKR